jgi:hypothetical protein
MASAGRNFPRPRDATRASPALDSQIQFLFVRPTTGPPAGQHPMFVGISALCPPQLLGGEPRPSARRRKSRGWPTRQSPRRLDCGRRGHRLLCESEPGRAGFAGHRSAPRGGLRSVRRHRRSMDPAEDRSLSIVHFQGEPGRTLAAAAVSVCFAARSTASELILTSSAGPSNVN